MSELFDNLITRMWDWIDNRGVIRRTVLAATMWMTWDVTLWATSFADRALELNRISTQTVAIVGAVTALVAGLGGYVFKVYLDSRKVE